jgi:hypothetical protein
MIYINCVSHGSHITSLTTQQHVHTLPQHHILPCLNNGISYLTRLIYRQNGARARYMGPCVRENDLMACVCGNEYSLVFSLHMQHDAQIQLESRE